MKTSFYIPDDLAAKAKKHGISVTEVARKALQKAVADAELLPTGEQLAAALIALGWTPPRSPKPGVARFGGWEFETHTWSQPSPDGRYEEEEVPTGQVTFRCDCGHRIHDRNTVVLGKARTHLAEQHPDWDQIPEEVESGSPATPAKDAS